MTKQPDSCSRRKAARRAEICGVAIMGSPRVGTSILPFPCAGLVADLAPGGLHLRTDRLAFEPPPLRAPRRLGGLSHGLHLGRFLDERFEPRHGLGAVLLLR